MEDGGWGAHSGLIMLWTLPSAAVREQFGEGYSVAAGRPGRRLLWMPRQELSGLPLHRGGCHGDGEMWVDARNVQEAEAKGLSAVGF